MKIAFLLLICVASSYALELGQFANLGNQIEQHVQNLIQNYKQQLLNIIQAQKPNFDQALNVVNQFISQLPVLQQVYVQKIKDVLVNFVQNLLNPATRLDLNSLLQQYQQQITTVVNELGSHLQQLALNALSQLFNGKRDLDLNNLLSGLSNLNLESLSQLIVPQLNTMLNNFLSNIISFGKRDLVSTAISLLGLGEVWSTIQALGQNTVAQITQIGTQLLFAGQQIWSQAQEIFKKLVDDLKNHTADAVPLVAQAVAQVTQLLASSGKRDLISTVISALGLGEVWSTIQALGQNTVNQVTQIGTQLLFAGQQVWSQAKEIFKQLVSDLHSHATDAVPLVAQAIAQVTQLLASSGKRDLVQFAINNLGLGEVVAAVQQAGANAVAQVLAQAGQLLFAGQQVIEEAKKVFNKLVDDLKNHTGNAVNIIQDAIAQVNQLLAGNSGKRDLVQMAVNALGLNDVWTTITTLASNSVAQFTQVITQVLFAGQQVFSQAKDIIKQLVADLKAHATDAVPLVAQAISQLHGLLPNAGKRDLASSVATLLGLNDVWATIQALGTNTVAQVVQIGTQLMTSGKEILAKAQAILKQLIDDLKNHANDGLPYVQLAVNKLKELLASQGK